MSKYLLALWLGFTSLASGAADKQAIDALIDALAPLAQLQGDFVQQQLDQDGLVQAESRGSFRLLRPGYFRWEITAPDRQLIVATPQYLWHFDRDLETVTRRPVGAAGSMAPLQILGGDNAALRALFSVKKGAAGQFILTPNSSGTGFQQLSIYLDDSPLQRMDIVDSLGQQMQVTFSALDAEAPLGAADFDFEAPPGADLFYYDQ